MSSSPILSVDISQTCSRTFAMFVLRRFNRSFFYASDLQCYRHVHVQGFLPKHIFIFFRKHFVVRSIFLHSTTQLTSQIDLGSTFCPEHLYITSVEAIYHLLGLFLVYCETYRRLITGSVGALALVGQPI